MGNSIVERRIAIDSVIGELPVNVLANITRRCWNQAVWILRPQKNIALILLVKLTIVDDKMEFKLLAIKGNNTPEDRDCSCNKTFLFSNEKFKGEIKQELKSLSYCWNELSIEWNDKFYLPQRILRKSYRFGIIDSYFNDNLFMQMKLPFR